MHTKLRNSFNSKELITLIMFLTLLYTFSLSIIFFPAISSANDDIRTKKDFGAKMERLLQKQSSRYFALENH